MSKNTVAVLMAEMGLAARRKSGRRATTRPGKGRWRAPDLVQRSFAAAAVNRKWYGDGTEIPTGEGKLHLASVLDMGSRRILGFGLSEHPDAELAYGALAMAVAVRGGQVPGVIMHTDQGSEYTARRFRQACGRLGIRQSMGRPGSALDNAVIESWHSTVEFELRASSSSPARRRPGPGSQRGSRTTTTTGGTPRWACSARSPTSWPWPPRTPRDRGGPAARARQEREGGGCAAADFPERRAGYGAAPPASRVLAHRAARDGLRPPWTPEPLRPLEAGRAGRPGLPRRARGAKPGCQRRQ